MFNRAPRVKEARIPDKKGHRWKGDFLDPHSMTSTLSYISTPLTENYIYESLPDRLRHLAKENGDKEAFVFYDKNWKRIAISRKELYDRSTSLAKVLVENGISKNGMVGFCMRNSINMLISSMAVACAGGISFFTVTNLKDGSDLTDVLVQTNCEMLFIDTDTDDDNWQILENIWPASLNKSEKTPQLKAIVCNGDVTSKGSARQPLDSLMSRIPGVAVQLPSVQPEDILVCFCTSGSTGAPKQIMDTHFQIFNFEKQLNNYTGMTGNSRYFCDRSFSWIVGYPRGFLTEGCTRVFTDPSLTLTGRSCDKLAEVIQQENVDIMNVPGYIAVDLLKNKHLASKFENVESITVTGERFPKAYVALKDGFCKKLCLYYGSTEAGVSAAFVSNIPDEYEDGIIGEPIAGVEAKIIDDTGAVVPIGVTGELCLRSVWRCVGFRGNEELFRQVVDNSNWLHTGDMAHIRKDGNLVTDGRRHEMISMQTSKFFPWQIEQTLKRIPGALHAFAVGVPDKRFHQVICACVVPKESAKVTVEGVREFCNEVFLEESSAMVVTTKPRYHVVLETLPLTSTGKIDRRGVATAARRILGL